MLLLVVLLGFVGVFVGAAWLALPAGVASAAGPLAMLSIVSVGVLLPLLLVCTITERLLDRESFSRLRDSAGDWVRSRLALLGITGVRVVSRERGGSAFHPPSSTILLRERVYAEHTLRARAVAAHELGHAELHVGAPRVGGALLWCRVHAPRLFGLALSLLVGNVLAPVPWSLDLARWLFVAAVGCSIAVVIDEVFASARAMAHLSADPELRGRHLAGAAVQLTFALVTYVAAAGAVALPLLLWPYITAHIGAGVLAPASGPLSTGSELVVLLAAAVMIGGAVSAVVMMVRGDRLGGGWASLGMVFTLLTLLMAPLFVALVCDQASVLAHPWTVVLGVAAIWDMLAAPLLVPVHFAGGYVGRKIDLVAAPSKFSGGSDKGSVGRASRARMMSAELAAAEGDDGLLDRVWQWHWLVLYLPIMAAYFELL